MNIINIKQTKNIRLVDLKRVWKVIRVNGFLEICKLVPNAFLSPPNEFGDGTMEWVASVCLDGCM